MPVSDLVAQLELTNHIWLNLPACERHLVCQDNFIGIGHSEYANQCNDIPESGFARAINLFEEIGCSTSSYAPRMSVKRRPRHVRSRGVIILCASNVNLTND